MSKRGLRKLACVKPRGGDDIDDIIDEMLNRATSIGIRVTCVFNDTQFTVEPGMSHEQAFMLWEEETQRQELQYQRSMKAAVSRREQKAREEQNALRAKLVHDMLEREKIQVPWYKRRAFNRAVRVAKAEPFSNAIVNYGIAWAVAMQQLLREGKKIADVADQLSQEVDYESITGNMYGKAVSFLARFWKHGEELRRWHNINVQIGQEGETANKGRGVLNPALLVLGERN